MHLYLIELSLFLQNLVPSKDSWAHSHAQPAIECQRKWFCVCSFQGNQHQTSYVRCKDIKEKQRQESKRESQVEQHPAG